jgi:hypothetical protein
VLTVAFLIGKMAADELLDVAWGTAYERPRKDEVLDKSTVSEHEQREAGKGSTLIEDGHIYCILMLLSPVRMRYLTSSDCIEDAQAFHVRLSWYALGTGPDDE